MSSEEPQLIVERRGTAGLITLNRPRALNALTLDMVREMHPLLDRWAVDPGVDRVIVDSTGDKAFCAGGDIRALYDWGRAGDPNVINFYREEYLLNVAIKRYPKPYIALMNGITMGGGVGVSVHGSHRVATENLTFAMPETGIGLFPDVGGTYFLPRCPGEIGLFLGLTGGRLKAADALYAGIADSFVAADRLADLRGALAEGGNVVAAIAAFATDPGDAAIAAQQPRIDRAFGAASLSEILDRLDSDGDAWSVNTAKTIRAKSPTSVRLAFRQIREGADLSFEDCMRLEYRLVNRVMKAHDFYEGTRAVVIDKDQAPKWQPESLDAVTNELIDEYFGSLGDDELPLQAMNGK